MDGPRLSGSYTFYLLQARPDLVSVQGFCADVKGIVLINSSSDSVKIEPRAEFEGRLTVSADIRLCYTLYYPLLSMTNFTAKVLTRMQNSLTSRWVFDIMLVIPQSLSRSCFFTMTVAT